MNGKLNGHGSGYEPGLHDVWADVPVSSGYAQAALDGEIKRVLGAVEGSRNDQLNRAAFSLGQLVAAGLLELDTVRDALEQAGRDVGLGIGEIRATIRSGLRGGHRNPRDVTGPPAGSDGVATPTGSKSKYDDLSALPGENDWDRRRRIFLGRRGIGVDAWRQDGPDGKPGPSRAGQQGAEPTARADVVRDGVAEVVRGHVERLRAALLDTDGLDGIPEPVALVGKLLYLDTLAWMFGAPGSCKSFTALDLAGCVATGEVWHGSRTKSGRVMYVAAEGVSGLKSRVRAWESSRGIRMRDVEFLSVAVQASNAAEWAAFVELAKERAPSLLIIDTQARVSVGLEENSATEMGRFVGRIEELRAATGACVLVIHHTGRGGEHMRGSIALDGAASTLIKVARQEDIVDVECVKQKDGPAWSPLRLRMKGHQTSIILLETEGSPSLTLNSPNLSRLADAWWDSFETDWVSPTRLIEATETPKASVFRHIKALVRVGLVESSGDEGRRRYRMLRAPSVSRSQVGLTESHGSQASTAVKSLTVSPPFRGETGETQRPSLGPSIEDDGWVS